MEAIKALSDDEMEQTVVGGEQLYHCPTNAELERMGLGDYVRFTSYGWGNAYYDTYRGNGEWKNVASDHMLQYVERTLGADDERYKALYKKVTNPGSCAHGR